MRALLVSLAAAFALVACAEKHTPVEESAADAAPAPPADAGASTPGAPPPSDAELAQAATATQESSDEQAGPGDASLERMVAMPENVQLPGGRWKAGTHYRPIVPSQGTIVQAGEVEIIEFVWLACGGCRSLNRHVEAWEAKLPDWVKFRQEHVMWGPSHRNLARLLYTLQTLDRGDLIDAAFDAVQTANSRMLSNNEAEAERAQLAFALANGIKEADFKREYRGFSVTRRLADAEVLKLRYPIDQTPVFIVNGKYEVNTRMVGDPTDMMQLLSDLAAAEKR
jgi:thiol:disulfide interchange protein DsbA